MAITCGGFQLIARVHGPQTSYQAKLMGLCVAAELAPSESTITLDIKKKAAVDYSPQNPHREASDIDLREMAAQVVQRKSITVRWIPGHRQLSDARHAQQDTDIIRNNEVDRLAKLATTLPLPLYTPTFPSSISLGGTEAPTPSNKWIAALCPYPTHPGVHWVTWLPLRARRSSGFGATSVGKGAPPLGRKPRSTVSFAMTCTGAPHMPDWYIVPPGARSSFRSGCGRWDHGQISPLSGSLQPLLTT